MTLPPVFITRYLPQAAIDYLQSRTTLDIWTERLPPLYSVLQERIQNVEGLLCLLTDTIDERLMQVAPSLKVISQMAVGYDNIDIAAATARGIPVGNTPGVLTEATADLTWALLMAAARRIVEAEQFVQQGNWVTWEPMLLLGADLTEATLGIVGLGRIGQAIARRAAGFGMRLCYWNRQRREAAIEKALGIEFVSFDQLLKESDFITLHVALSSETYHLFSQQAFEQMKPSAILINTARGPIIEADALYNALKTGQIAGAALDVTDPEPIPMDSPLLSLPNLLITPHIGSASQKTRTKMAMIAAENLVAGLRGEPLPHCVNPNVYGN